MSGLVGRQDKKNNTKMKTKTNKNIVLICFLYACASVKNEIPRNPGQREMTALELKMHKRDLKEMAEKNTTELGRGLTQEEQDLIFKKRSPTAEEEAIIAEYFLPPTAEVELLDVRCPDNVCTYTLKIKNITAHAGTGHAFYSLQSQNESFRPKIESTSTIEPGHYEIIESNSNQKPVSSIVIDAWIVPISKNSGIKTYRGGTTPSVHKVYITEDGTFREPTPE